MVISPPDPHYTRVPRPRGSSSCPSWWSYTTGGSKQYLLLSVFFMQLGKSHQGIHFFNPKFLCSNPWASTWNKFSSSFFGNTKKSYKNYTNKTNKSILIVKMWLIFVMSSDIFFLKFYNVQQKGGPLFLQVLQSTWKWHDWQTAGLFFTNQLCWLNKYAHWKVVISVSKLTITWE